MNFDIAIIGSGLGGLECGAILSRLGLKVVILEQARQIGGSIQSYKRGNHLFDTGLHYVGGLAEGQALHGSFSFLGLLELPWKRMDDCFDLIQIGDQQYRLMQGWDNFIDELSQQFPHQREALERYADRMHHITPDDMEVNAWDYLHETFSDETLIQVLSAGAMKIELRKESLPLFNYAHAQCSYIDSSWRLQGSGNLIIKRLTQTILKAGGQIMTSAQVVKLQHDDTLVQHVILADGRQIESTYVVADIHPQLLASMLDESIRRTKHFVKRSQQAENTFGMFTASLVLKAGRLPYLNHNIYIYDTPDVWDFYRNGDKVSGVMISCRVPDDDSPYTTQVDLLTPMMWDECLPWVDSTTRHRTESYKKMCADKSQACIQLAEKAIPGLGQLVETIYTSTPLTYRDYLMSPEGAAFGTRKDSHNAMLTFGTVKSPLLNLFLTGQSVCLPGIEGVTMTAYDTCRQILGNESINSILQ